MDHWVGKTSQKADSSNGFTDLEMFNIMSGIEKKVIAKPK